jgi:hypothetical protein
MNRLIFILMVIGLVGSACIGIWHFTVPYLYNWYSYIPTAPRAIIVSIDWINFFFSLLLTGTSVLLLIFRKEIAQRNRVAVTLYGFLTFVWACRVGITLIDPWGYDWMLVIQLAVFCLMFILFVIPFISLIARRR